MFARFSTVAGEQGFPDTVRDPRGFALKFYTDEGNFDMVGNNTPVFFVRDPSKFQDFIHSQKRLPDTGLRSNDMQWDFWTLSPESAHQVTILMSDRGIPRHAGATWTASRSHTYSWMNAGGERFWVKYHFKTDQGIENLTERRGRAPGRRGRRPPPPRPARRDRRGRRAGVDASTCRSCRSPTRPTTASTRSTSPRSGRKGDYPLIEVGRMVLDRNPANFFAEVEQAELQPVEPRARDRPVARTGC